MTHVGGGGGRSQGSQTEAVTYFSQLSHDVEAEPQYKRTNSV